MSRFIKLIRFEDNPDLETLIQKHHNEFILLTVIAMRARRSAEPCKFTGLKQGEAMIGDWAACGLTQQKYRTAKKNLEAWNYVTFRATSKGTIATLCDSGIYDINAEQGNDQDNEQITIAQRADNDQVTTKKNVNNDNNDKNERTNNVAIAPESSVKTEPIKETGERIANAPSPQVPPHPPSPTENAIAGQVLDYYNQKRGNMSKAVAMTNQRRSAIKARLKEYGEETVMGAIDMAAESDFLQGRTECGFSCGIDWLMGPKNFIKVVEGNYKNKARQAPTRNVNLDLI